MTLLGFTAMRWALLEIAGEIKLEGSGQFAAAENHVQLGLLFSTVGGSLDGEVTHGEFLTLVANALALRSSLESPSGDGSVAVEQSSKHLASANADISFTSPSCNSYKS